MANTGEFPALADQAADDAPEFPRTFGNYLLLSRLARGGMGEVFLAKHGGIAGIEKHCVVKTLRPHYTDDREYTARFIDEARVVVQLSHRNIAQVFDVGRVGGQYYLAMEFIQGRDVRLLQDTLNERGTPMTEGIALHIVCEVLEALDYAHRHQDPTTGRPLNLVHRDVSPQNVMVNFEGEVKLIDFGLAASEMKAEHTQPNVVMGKLAYMAPEQARGDAVDGRVDLFAVAVMAYELFSGARYYEGMSSHEMWTISGSGGHIPTRWGELHRDLQDILAKGLHPDRDRRFATCADFREALEGYRFNRGYRERASNLRALIADVWPSAADESRDLLSRFSNVKLMRQEDPAEQSQTFAASPAFAGADVLQMHPGGQIPDHDDTVLDMVPSNPNVAAPPPVHVFRDTPDTVQEHLEAPGARRGARVALLLILLLGAGGAGAWAMGWLDGVMGAAPEVVDDTPPPPSPPPVIAESPPVEEPPGPPDDPGVVQPDDPEVEPPTDVKNPVETKNVVKDKQRRRTRRARRRRVKKPPDPMARLERMYSEIVKKCSPTYHGPAANALKVAKTARPGDKSGEVNLGRIYKCTK